MPDKFPTCQELDHDRNGHLDNVDLIAHWYRYGEVCQSGTVPTPGAIAAVVLLQQEIEALPIPQDLGLLSEVEGCCWCAGLRWPGVTDVPELRSLMILCRYDGTFPCPWRQA